MDLLQFVNFRLLLPGIRWHSCPVNFNDERRHILDCPTGALQRGGAATGAPRALTGRSATCAPHTPSSSHSAPPPRPSRYSQAPAVRADPRRVAPTRPASSPRSPLVRCRLGTARPSSLSPPRTRRGRAFSVATTTLTVVADATATRVSGLPQGFDYARGCGAGIARPTPFLYRSGGTVATIVVATASA